jgi:hypothetical protein
VISLLLATDHVFKIEETAWSRGLVNLPSFALREH